MAGAMLLIACGCRNLKVVDSQRPAAFLVIKGKATLLPDVVARTFANCCH